MHEYSVVIPAYNEEARITSTLTQIVSFMDDFSADYEVIVVDDGSADETVEIVQNYAHSHNKIRIIQNPHKGKGYAVRTGVLDATGEFILLCDADMATPIQEIKRLLVWLKDHDFDIAIASREGVGAERKNEPYLRHIMGRVFNMIIQMLILPGIEDTQCGFKLFNKKAAHNIFKRLVLFGPDTPDTKKPRVSAFDVEVLVIAKRLGFKIKEVPVSWSYVSNTKVHPVRDSINNFMDVMRIKLNDVRGLYK